MTGSRARLGLDGTWMFWVERERSVSSDPIRPQFVDAATRSAALGAPRPIVVPGVWQAQFDDLRLFSGSAWYERSFALPNAWADRRVRICFGAVDYFCAVWINGTAAGSHEGGYLPFDFDVTTLVRRGERNDVTVFVVDPGAGDVDPFDFAEIPHGKQSWYGPQGGLWQSVFLEATPWTFVDGAAIQARPAASSVEARIRLGGEPEDGDVVVLSAASPDGLERWSSDAFPPGAVARLEVPKPELWAPETPRLYRLIVTLIRGGREVDSWYDDFGFRTVAAEGGRLLLNGQPFYLLAALDQDYYHHTLGTPPSDALLRRQFALARELGINSLRCHLKAPDPRYLRWTDRLGILVWAELPNFNRLTEVSAARARETLKGIIERDFNHPSIAMWTIANESWGLDLVGEPSHRAWLRDTYSWVKGLDPTRLVVDNSPVAPNFHLETDVNDVHVYRAWPDHFGEWERWTEAWVRNPGSTFSPHGDDRRSGEEPLILSEFGHWGLSDVRRLRAGDGRDPWWTDTGAEFGDGTVVPAGVEERFSQWRLDEAFGSWTQFIRHSQNHQFEALAESIRDLRSHSEISGYVITELTDVHWECNGLLDMARNPKSYHHRFREINAPDVVLARPRRRRYRSDETVQLDVLLSHYSARDVAGSIVEWRAGDQHAALRADGLRRGEVRLENIAFTAPSAHIPTPLTVELVWRDAGRRIVNRSATELLVFPRLDPADREEARAGAGRIPVSDSLADVSSHVGRGGRAVIVARGAGALDRGTSLSVRARAGTRWEGDWAQGMGFLRPSLSHSLGCGPRVSSFFLGLTPDHVVTGYRPRDALDILAGYYVGWVRDTVATIGAFRYGEGGAILCTLPLLDSYEDDPLAATLLDRLLKVVSSRDFTPTARLK